MTIDKNKGDHDPGSAGSQLSGQYFLLSEELICHFANKLDAIEP